MNNNDTSVGKGNGSGAAGFTSSYIDEPTGSFVVRVILIVCVLLAAFLGNLIVIGAIYNYKIPDRKPRPFSYTLVLNLAVGELLNVIFLPFMLVYEHTLDWVFGEFLCKIINPLQVMCLTNVTVTLAAIAVNRWRVLTAPYTGLPSPLKTKIIVASFWFVGATLAMPLLWLREMTPRGDGRNRCSWKSHDDRGVYMIVHEFVCYVVPFLIMIVAYTLVGLRLRQHIVVTKRNREAEYRMNNTSTCSGNNMLVVGSGCNLPPQSPTTPIHRNHRESRQLKRACVEGKGMIEMEHDLIRMMYIIVFSFIVCYVPYQLFFILHHVSIWQQWRYGLIVAAYFQWLILFPSALHPLFYGTKSKFFTKAFSSLVACKDGMR